jgi:hypothetical protein
MMFSDSLKIDFGFKLERQLTEGLGGGVVATKGGFEGFRPLFHQGVIDAVGHPGMSSSVQAVARMNAGVKVVPLAHDDEAAAASADRLGRATVAPQ